MEAVVKTNEQELVDEHDATQATEAENHTGEEDGQKEPEHFLVDFMPPLDGLLPR